MAKKVFGLASLQIADIANDGGIGSNWETVGETVSGTAQMAQEDNTTTEFNIEESDSPVESIVSAAGKVTFAWSSYDISYSTLKKLFGGTGNLQKYSGSINVLGAITAGSSYITGYYENVPLTGGGGTGARANITVNGSGAITAVTLTALGTGYSATNNLSASNANLGGAGSGFNVVVTSVFSTAAAETWQAPDSFPDIEKSLKIVDKKGNILKAARVKISSKLGLSFAKDKLGQLDMVATILQPTKAGEPRIDMSFAQ